MGIMQSYRHSENATLMSWPPDFDVFDRNPDPALDEITELAAVLSLADYAYIGWMDFNRLWFKSRYGFNAPEQPRASSGCNWVVTTGQPVLVADTSADRRFPPDGIEVPAAANCRSYAGVPLISTDQQILGTL